MGDKGWPPPNLPLVGGTKHTSDVLLSVGEKLLNS